MKGEVGLHRVACQVQVWHGMRARLVGRISCHNLAIWETYSCVGPHILALLVVGILCLEEHNVLVGVHSLETEEHSVL